MTEKNPKGIYREGKRWYVRDHKSNRIKGTFSCAYDAKVARREIDKKRIEDGELLRIYETKHNGHSCFRIRYRDAAGKEKEHSFSFKPETKEQVLAKAKAKQAEIALSLFGIEL